MKEEKVNENILKFGEELGEIVGQIISPKHIHHSLEGRHPYIQSPEEGYPMLLHHYRGPYFVDIHPRDYEDIMKGKISPHDYIYSANWLIGYFWGGGGMMTGGYYQPFDIVNRKEEVQRYFKILKCRGLYRASAHVPSYSECVKCPVDNCPMSNYKEGDWENELSEHDPRIDFFNVFCSGFNARFKGYVLNHFSCSNIEYNKLVLTPNLHYSEKEPYSYSAYVSEEFIRDILIRRVGPDDSDDILGWVDIVSSFDLVLHEFGGENYLEATPDNLKLLSEKNDFVTKQKSRFRDKVHDLFNF